MIEKEVVVLNEEGLHARPASILVQEASKFSSQITVYKDELEVNAKSIMGVLLLCATKGTNLKFVIKGEDEEAAAARLEELFLKKFEI